MANDLVTKTEYKSYIGITGDGQDTSISALIPKVSNLIKNYCRRSFIDYVEDPKIEIFNGGDNKLLLKEYPVLIVAGVETSTDYGQTYTDLAEYVDYIFDVESDCIVSVATTFPKLINGYQVTYTAGYEDLPEDLKLAAFDLITYYLRNDAVTHNLRIPTTQVMQFEYTSASSFPAHIARVLNLYKASWD